jgi:fatty-acyl-CoA synthase
MRADIPAFGRVGFFWIATGRNVLLDFSPSEALRLIETERVTMVNLVPTMAAMMLADPSLPGRDLRSLRALIFAGAMFPAPLRERVAAEISSAVYEYYGMQETGLLTLSTPEGRVRQPESIGLPVCFAEVKIARADGGRAAPGGFSGALPPPSPATSTIPRNRQKPSAMDGCTLGTSASRTRRDTCSSAADSRT